MRHWPVLATTVVAWMPPIVISTGVPAGASVVPWISYGTWVTKRGFASLIVRVVADECRTQNAEVRMKKRARRLVLNSEFCVLPSAFIDISCMAHHCTPSRLPDGAGT